MNKQIFEDFERELNNIKFRDILDDEQLLSRLIKLQILIADFLHLINPKTKPFVIPES